MQHCFVVDDSDVIRKYTRLIFEAMNFRVSEADKPVTAYDRLKTESPDLILVDWRIQGSDMHEFIRRVRRLPLHTRPTIIYTPTENDAQDIKAALGAGADAYLLKPYNREILEMKLQELRAEV